MIIIPGPISLDQIHSFSEISEHLSGPMIKMRTLVDVPIVIWRYEIQDSIYRRQDNDPNKQYMKIQFSYESNLQKKYVTSTSSYYLIKDILSIAKDLPVRASIVHKPLPPRDERDTVTRFAYILN